MNQEQSSARTLNLRDLRGADETRLVDRKSVVQFDEQEGLQHLQIGELKKLYGKRFHQLFDGPIFGIHQIFSPVGTYPIYYQGSGSVLWDDITPPPWNIPSFPFSPLPTLPGGFVNGPYPYDPNTDGGGGTGFPGGEPWNPLLIYHDGYFSITPFIVGDTEVSTVTTSNVKHIAVAGLAAPDLLSPPAIVDDWIVTPATYIFSSTVQSSKEWLTSTRFDNLASTWYQQASRTDSKSRFVINIAGILADDATYFLVKDTIKYKTGRHRFSSYYPDFGGVTFETIRKRIEIEIAPDLDTGLVGMIEPGTPAVGHIFGGPTGTALGEEFFGYEEIKLIHRVIKQTR